MTHDIPVTSTEQVNAAIRYLTQKGQVFWKLDLKSCKLYARLVEKSRTR